MCVALNVRSAELPLLEPHEPRRKEPIDRVAENSGPADHDRYGAQHRLRVCGVVGEESSHTS